MQKQNQLLEFLLQCTNWIEKSKEPIDENKKIDLNNFFTSKLFFSHSIMKETVNVIFNMNVPGFHFFIYFQNLTFLKLFTCWSYKVADNRDIAITNPVDKKTFLIRYFYVRENVWKTLFIGCICTYKLRFTKTFLLRS